jgi:hypothetical protein
MTGLEAIQALARKFYRSPEHAQWLAIEQDTGLTPEAKEQRAAPLRKAATEAFDKLRAEAAAIVASSQASWLEHTPRAIQRAASSGNDRADRALTRGAAMDPNELLQTARLIARENDAAAAHGLRLALGRREDLPEAVYAEIMTALDQAGTQGYLETEGDLLAAQLALAELALAGPRGDPFAALLADPTRAITGATEWRVVVDEAGETRAVPEAEARRLLAMAEAPPGPLLATVLPTAPDGLTRFLAGMPAGNWGR